MKENLLYFIIKFLFVPLWVLLSSQSYASYSQVGEHLPEYYKDVLLQVLEQKRLEKDELSLLKRNQNVELKLNIPINIKAGEGRKAVTLWASLLKPVTDKPRPTILTLTPYRRELMVLQSMAMVDSGYNILVVDIRGTGSSEGNWMSFDYREQLDAAFVIDKWIPKQEWSNGIVGTIGASYMAIIQMFAAGLVEKLPNGEPKHLKAMVPMLAMSDAYRDIVMQGGNLNTGFIPMWLGGVDIMSIMPPIQEIFEEGRLSLRLLKKVVDTWKSHIGHIPTNIGWILDPENIADNGFYEERSPMIYWKQKPKGGYNFGPANKNTLPEKLPVFLQTSWYDIFTRGTLNHYQYGLAHHKPEDKAMVIGRGYHFDSGLKFAGQTYQDNSLYDRWFDWKLKGKEDSIFKDFPVLMYIMGKDRWRYEKEWPLPASRVEKKTFWLSKKKVGINVLDWHSVANYGNNYYLTANKYNAERYSSKRNPKSEHDPKNLHGMKSRSSVRWTGGVPALVHKMVGLEEKEEYWEDERSDEIGALTFTTPPFKEDFEISGPLLIKFWAKTKFKSKLKGKDKREFLKKVKGQVDLIEGNMIERMLNRKDVQWIVKVSDVHPNGRSRNITSGWLSSWHRPAHTNSLGSLVSNKIDPNYDPFDPFYFKSNKNPMPIKENTLYQYAVETLATGNMFKKGHRMRISVSYSDFPHLLPLITPSENQIVIDRRHEATVEVNRVKNTGFGTQWKWFSGQY